MRAVTEVLDPAAEAETTGEQPRREWNPLTRIAFRFTFAYLTLFCVLFAQILYVYTGVFFEVLPEDAVLWQMRTVAPLVEWVGSDILGVRAELNLGSGSGDQMFIWVLLLTEAVVAAVITVVWSVLDRRRTEYVRLGSWFLLFLRLCLAGQMVFYGVAKLIPNQMPLPSLTAMLTPYGDLGLFQVLWYQVGSAPAYESLLGAAEVLGGVLLFIPRTATAGALLSLISMAQVFVLNMTFNVPVKSLSLHLMVISLVLLAPQARRLANLLVLERPSDAAVQPPVFRDRRSNAIVGVVTAVLGLWVIAGSVQLGIDGYRTYGNGAPKPELYGIWNVTEFALDGQPVPPLITDETRWRRVVFDIAGAGAYQRMDDKLVPALTEVDIAAHTIALSQPQGPDAPPARLATFTFDRPTEDRLTLRGELNGRPATVTLERMDLNQFRVRDRDVHWVQDTPDGP